MKINLDFLFLKFPIFFKMLSILLVSSTLAKAEIDTDSTLRPDDFSTTQSGLWSFENPLEDSSFNISSGRLSISVPEGHTHHIWHEDLSAPMLLQPANNANVLLETKIASPMDASSQMAGFVFWQDETNLAAFFVYSDNNGIYIASLTKTEGKLTLRSSKAITAHFAIHLRVSRDGDIFRFDYSYDRITWYSAKTLIHRMITTRAGLFAGNSKNNPAYSGVFDYFAVDGVGLPSTNKPIEDTTILVSDSFAQLDPGLWTFVDPAGDSEAEINDGRLKISLAEGSTHDLWSHSFDSPRLVQQANNALFTIETKIHSPLSTEVQMAGILVSDGINKFVRADVAYLGGKLHLIAAGINGNNARSDKSVIVDQFPLYLRLARINNLDWDFVYSYNGSTWIQGPQFSFPMNVAEAGLFAGNNQAGKNTPSLTAVFEYFKAH